MKKFISGLLATAMAATMAVPAFAADTFKDVPSKHWAYEYVEDMADRGFISGYGNGTFGPDNQVSRMDAFSLFSRMLGSNSEVNEDALEIAKEEYGDILRDYNLTYAEGDIAFLLHRGVIDEDDLDTYFAGNKKTEAMPRFEAAILITKAMLAEEEATAEVLIDMDYKDVTDIPKEAKQYVYYVTQKGIMNGVGDGSFAPNIPVQRSQIAVMLSKTISSTNYYFEKAKITGVDTDINNISIADYDGQIGYLEETRFTMDGEVVTDAKLKKGQSVILTYSESDSGVRLVFVDILGAEAYEVDETKNVIFKRFTSNGGDLVISAKDALTGVTDSYDCSSSVKVIIDGVERDINKLEGDEYVLLGLADGMVVEITTMPTSETIKNATLDKINPMGSITISHEDKDYDGKTFVLANDARIVKNGNVVEFVDLYRGDSVTVKLEYGVVSTVTATAVKKTVTGIIKSYTISSEPTLTIRANGEDIVYDISADMNITIGGEKAKLADFEIGSEVTVTIESDVVKSIKASVAAGTTSGSTMSGVVTNVNTSAQVIIISGDDGEVNYITCKESTNIHVVPTLNSYTLKQIKVGDSIVAYGSYQNGIFVCTGMTVTPSVK